MKTFRIHKIGHLWALENRRAGRVLFSDSFPSAVEQMQVELLENAYGSALNGHLA